MCECGSALRKLFNGNLMCQNPACAHCGNQYHEPVFTLKPAADPREKVTPEDHLKFLEAHEI